MNAIEKWLCLLLLDQFYGRKSANDQKNPGHTEANCFKRMFEEIANHK